MKTILIPTDYQAISLNSVDAVCSQLKGEDLNLIFIHLFKLSDSVTDLLMLSNRSREYEKVNDAFYERLTRMQAQYPQIKSVRIEFFYGSTLSMFRNFLEANEVDAVAYDQNSAANPIHKSSIDPSVLVSKTGLPIISTTNKTYARVKKTEFAPAYRQQQLAEI
ncbi:hypothetical protein [Mucilaginibacter glaciei]|uniref:Universal stress protein n=1 Tax=Mucilaginibacter glaciei TaxID=2772109 RepID=A0A926S5X1_9SPHI|nr:hypothetical protein [Mucilaginibacter glaciei]MBD1393176.1 hypothetical protein [Mucilaginibacter glaciei]